MQILYAYKKPKLRVRRFVSKNYGKHFHYLLQAVSFNWENRIISERYGIHFINFHEQ